VAKYYTDQSMQNLRAVFEKVVLQWPQVRAKKMFGCPCYQAGGKLFALLVNNGVALTHLPENEREALALKTLVTNFQANEKSIPAWPVARFENKADLSMLLPFIQASYQSALEER
jgi:hypothetical protein